MASFWNIVFDIWSGPSSRWLWCLVGLLVFLTCKTQGDYGDFSNQKVTAIVNVTHRDPVTGEIVSYEGEMGIYGTKSRIDSEEGIVVHVRTKENKTDGCSEIVNVPKTKRWIALIQRGKCKFHEKIHNAAVEKNASAVVIYNDKVEKDLLTMEHQGKSLTRT